MDMYKLKNLRSRAATAENPNAEVGEGGTAGGGRKGQPCIWPVEEGKTYTLLDTEGPGMIRHFWCTIPPGQPLQLRNLILRMYWDGQEQPSVEVPLGDFFGLAHGRQLEVASDLIQMQSGKGFNCWIPMPFRKHARITIENDSGEEVPMFFYQIDFTLDDELDGDAGYFHAQFRRQNPCPQGEDYTILDGIQGRGTYLGTVLGVRSRCKAGWWGEGEVKFYIDDDKQLPTICGTGAEDYVGCAWGLDPVTAPCQGAPLVHNELGLYSFYRLHHRDPICFQKKLKVTIQQIGFADIEEFKAKYKGEVVDYQPAGAQKGPNLRYVERSDDWSSVALWYQELPTSPFPTLPDRAARSADLLLKLDATETPKRGDE
jgi:hypothetical protein